jgi:hypothetical protein
LVVDDKSEASDARVPLPKITWRNSSHIVIGRTRSGSRRGGPLAGARLGLVLLLELGTPPHVVQAIARHADLHVTLGVYAHTNLDAMRKGLGPGPGDRVSARCYTTATYSGSERPG